MKHVIPLVVAMVVGCGEDFTAAPGGGIDPATGRGADGCFVLEPAEVTCPDGAVWVDYRPDNDSQRCVMENADGTVTLHGRSYGYAADGLLQAVKMYRQGRGHGLSVGGIYQHPQGWTMAACQQNGVEMWHEDHGAEAPTLESLLCRPCP